MQTNIAKCNIYPLTISLIAFILFLAGYTTSTTKDRVMNAQTEVQSQQVHQMAWSTYIDRKAGLELEYSNAIECVESWKAADPKSLMIDYNQRRLDTARDALNELEREYYGDWFGYSNTMRSVGKVY